jgi:hypothetical protein
MRQAIRRAVRFILLQRIRHPDGMAHDHRAGRLTRQILRRRGTS